VRRERMKVPSILTAIAGSGLALLSWSQPWFELVLTEGAGAPTGRAPIAVAGQVASPALAALALAGLALAGALAIAGPAVRVVLGVLAVVLGGCILLAAGISIGDPVAAVAPAVAEATGVTGTEPSAALVESAAATPWPIVAVVGGGLVAASGVLVLATGTRWPVSARRYRGARLAADGAAASGADRAIDDWDELSRGDDPTGDVAAADPSDESDAEPSADAAAPGAEGAADDEPTDANR
jgi:uncharacterized membrane protein (TIGR02234 family)